MMTEATVAPIADPAEAVTAEDLTKWYELTKQLEAVKDLELTMRKRIFAGLFKDPVEGVNKVNLTAGWILKADHKINRRVDEALLVTMSPQFREAGINPDVLVRWKPDLAVTEYRKLTELEMKLFDQVLTITPGTPQMEIVLPKRK
jgi:hypothetical protein